MEQDGDEEEERTSAEALEAERKETRGKTQNILDKIKLQADPTKQPKLRQVTLLKKNKNSKDYYEYQIQRVIFPTPRPKQFPKAEEIQAVIRWDDTTTPISMLPKHLQEEAMESAKTQWDNPNEEIREVALKMGEWTLLLAQQKNLIMEDDVIEALKRLQANSSEKEMQQHVREALKYLKKARKI